MKRHPTEWEKMFANHIGNKGLIVRVPEEHIQLSKKKKKKKNQITQFKTGTKYLTLFQQKHAKCQYIAEHHQSSEKCKTKMKYHLTFVWMAVIKNR